MISVSDTPAHKYTANILLIHSEPKHPRILINHLFVLYFCWIDILTLRSVVFKQSVNLCAPPSPLNLLISPQI